MIKGEYAGQRLVSKRIARAIKREENRKPRKGYTQIYFEKLLNEVERNKKLTKAIEETIEKLYDARNEMEDNGHPGLPIDHPLIQAILKLEASIGRTQPYLPKEVSRQDVAP